ncbi:I78 family peptidase inhibitor [Pollutimonas harenae]|uniref:Peptidase inhibitor I78 family protein n=1 Tax=Pollutimonas harenae TaxID=657015 RepID=A0A853GXH6_9BURK|nr:I78 family peptidase inhibitor [Pollutimonas harenae]NYT84039.1 hypothetical protein [Pollutimonas harenae]TEA73536.1 hypothetical protein ERD84_06440 [Pollutimonas harenae]
MTRTLIFGAVLAVATLAGCASGTQGTGSDTFDPASASSSSTNNQQCNADLAESAVGQKATPELLETYRDQSGAKQARILRPRDVITMEYNPQRLNLRVDEQDMVISVNCS